MLQILRSIKAKRAMKVFPSSQKAVSFCRRGTVVTMGNYDGVHRGHRAILERLTTEAKKRHLPAIVYTFDPHPVKFLAPQAAPLLINTRSQKAELLASCNINAVIFEKFDRSFANHSPEVFFRKFLLERLKPAFIIVGYDFTFGAKRQGNIETLERLCFEHQIDVQIMQAHMEGETLVSSTLVRKLLTDGRVKEAKALLGRPFFIEGTVVPGDRRGRELGIPTANLKPENELLPANGVYVTKTLIKGREYGSVTNVGLNPTFGGSSRRVETHIFALKKNLYRKKIRLQFLDKIRDEKTFAGAEDLVKQIKKDMDKAKQILSREKLRPQGAEN